MSSSLLAGETPFQTLEQVISPQCPGGQAARASAGLIPSATALVAPLKKSLRLTRTPCVKRPALPCAICGRRLQRMLQPVPCCTMKRVTSRAIASTAPWATGVRYRCCGWRQVPAMGRRQPGKPRWEGHACRVGLRSQGHCCAIARCPYVSAPPSPFWRRCARYSVVGAMPSVPSKGSRTPSARAIQCRLALSARGVNPYRRSLGNAASSGSGSRVKASAGCPAAPWAVIKSRPAYSRWLRSTARASMHASLRESAGAWARRGRWLKASHASTSTSAQAAVLRRERAAAFVSPARRSTFPPARRRQGSPARTVPAVGFASSVSRGAAPRRNPPWARPARTGVPPMRAWCATRPRTPASRRPSRKRARPVGAAWARECHTPCARPACCASNSLTVASEVAGSRRLTVRRAIRFRCRVGIPRAV